MFKKIGLILIFLMVVTGVALLLYRFFFSGGPVATLPPGTEVPPGGGGLPIAQPGQPGGGGVFVPGTGLPTARPTATAQGGVTETPTVTPQSTFVAAPTTSSGQLSFFNRADGKFYRRMPDGSLQPLSEKTFAGAEDVTWSRQGDKAVIEFPDASKVIYDFSAQKQVTLPRHWEDFSFSADGGSIAAKSIGLDPDNRWLVMAAADGSGAKLVEPLGENGDKVVVSVSPDNTIVAFSDTGDPVGFDTRDILLIGQNNENYPALRVEGFGFLPKWAPNSDLLVYSAAAQGSKYLPTLWAVRAGGGTAGQGRTNLGLQTWADKCAFADSTTLYCAVPVDLPEGAGLQRDIADTIPDVIYRVDLRSGGTVLVGRPERDISIRTLVVAPDGSRLYFTGSDNALREMRLR